MKNLFETEGQREKAVNALEGLLRTPGWKLIEKIVDANTEVLRERIVDGEGSKGEIDRLRERLRAYDDVKGTPRFIISELTAEGAEIPNPDPFLTVEEMAKKVDKDNSA